MTGVAATPEQDADAGAGQAHTGPEPLACLSGFISQNCADSGCHDAQTRSYGMDLSTGASIFSAWVNRNGLDNCGGQLRPRIVPGKPEESFVFQKLTSQLTCVGSMSQPMPPPPAGALSPGEIEIVRAWILAGAPQFCVSEAPTSAGGSAGSATGGTGTEGGNAGTSGGAGADNATAGGATGGSTGGSGGAAEDPFKCSASTPCTGQLICHALNCGTRVWDCISHRPLPAESSASLPPGYEPHHPCPTETMDYCGCDGVTFQASVTCPDRPYQHPGACADGYNCYVADSLCDRAAPSCDAGETPSIVDECFADCVPAGSCRCEFNWECPSGWQCDRTQWRCVLPASSQGT
ncbi:MAG TPA: hypothetical protein VHB79_01665 [Polyangiaceae bacterium]|nr:hypothetical protein [Polyangiaceae bacterium]